MNYPSAEISGLLLGRPPKNVSQEQKRQAQLDEKFRNCIEGKFGQAKRRFGLNRVMTKLQSTFLKRRILKLKSRVLINQAYLQSPLNKETL